MQIYTRFWGDTEYTSKDIIHLKEGLFGFEHDTEYILIRFAEDNSTMLYLQSLSNEQLGFIVMNPFHLLPAYSPELSDEEVNLLEIENAEDMVCYVICVANMPVDETTVNLKCPLVINTKNHQGMQIILDNQEYRFKHRLSDFRKEESAC